MGIIWYIPYYGQCRKYIINHKGSGLRVRGPRCGGCGLPCFCRIPWFVARSFGGGFQRTEEGLGFRGLGV